MGPPDPPPVGGRSSSGPFSTVATAAEETSFPLSALVVAFVVGVVVGAILAVVLALGFGFAYQPPTVTCAPCAACPAPAPCPPPPAEPPPPSAPSSSSSSSSLTPPSMPRDPVVSAEACGAVLASGDTDGRSDAFLVDCARKHFLGACVLFEKSTGWCPPCACSSYVQDANICTTDGTCGAPMNGSGCTSMPPAGCAGNDDVTGGACFLRTLVAQRLCSGRYYGD